MFCTIAESPIDGSAEFNFDGWLEQVRQELNEPQATGVIFWHPRYEETPAEKRRRVNVHIFDRALRPLAFAKISFDEQNDRRLCNEAETIVQLHEKGLGQLHVPRVVLLSKMAGHAYLLVEPLPVSVRPVELKFEAFPKQCVAEYAGPVKHIPAESVERLSWWGKYKKAIRGRCHAFADELDARIENGVEVCRVHGDMQPSNVLCDGKRVWIFDWEDSCSNGPVMTDLVNFYMVLHIRQTISDPDAQLARFRDRFLREAGPERRLAVMLAIAFRSTVGPEDAILFMEHWHSRGQGQP